MSALSRSHIRRLSAALRLFDDLRGTTAVEFGLVALPFLALLGAIVQISFTIWAQQNFDFVFQKAIRTVFTGQFQGSNSQSSTDATLLAALQNQMCGGSSAGILFDCSHVKLDLSVVAQFAGATFPNPIDPKTQDWNPNFGTNYTCASPGSIVVATAAVKFPVILGLLDAGLSNFSDGSKLLMSTAIFRVEPYTSASSSPCASSSS